jgi:hypothetical protein
MRPNNISVERMAAGDAGLVLRASRVRRHRSFSLGCRAMRNIIPSLSSSRASPECGLTTAIVPSLYWQSRRLRVRGMALGDFRVPCPLRCSRACQGPHGGPSSNMNDRSHHGIPPKRTNPDRAPSWKCPSNARSGVVRSSSSSGPGRPLAFNTSARCDLFRRPRQQCRL